MCLSCSGGHKPRKVNRRGFLGGAGAVAAALGAGVVTAGRSAADPIWTSSLASFAGSSTPDRAGSGKLSVVLLGTQAGPPVLPERTGIATAVVVDGDVYVVDCGRGSATQYVHAGLRFDRLKAIFLTHLHADHVADYYNFLLLGGHLPNRFADHVDQRVNVYGPGSAGGLPPAFGGGQVATVGTNPTPGTVEMTQRLHDAYAYSTNIFMRDSGISDIRTLVNPTDIAVPDVGADYLTTAPDMEPFTVMEDNRVRVSAVLVPHGVCYPSFAYRFDTEYGSVTFSGDTTYTDNIPRLAQGTDLLIHEAINAEGSTLPPVVLSHMLDGHVEVQKVGAIAERAGARRLVLSHIGDITHGIVDAKAWHGWAQRGYSGPVTIGADLQKISIA